MSAIEKGEQRYQRFRRSHITRFGAPPAGRLLDFGCGAGGFLIAALRNGLDVHGIEVDPQRHVEFLRNAERHEPSAKERITLYPGRLMPYPSNHFEACHSFMVFEHVPDPQTCLREIVRVLKPGGTLTLWADDVRNEWDGHAQVPWPPYLPREFAAAYLDGLGLPEHAEFVTNSVVYISAPAITDILTTLGMEIVYQNEGPAKEYRLLAGIYVTNEREARELGETVRAAARLKALRSPFVSARKIWVC